MAILPGDSLVLSLAEFRLVIEVLNRSQGRWWFEYPIVPRPERLTPEGTMVEVFHSRGGANQVTDELSFLVPVFGDWSDENQALVCLYPDLIVAEMEGLYFERGRVLGDCLEDWFRFWTPLKQAAYDWVRTQRPSPGRI
jgi:hypothetical protein